MKVLHVIAGLPPQGGGPTTAIFGTLRALRARGLDGEIATTDSNIWGNLEVPLGERVIDQGVPVYYFRSPLLRKYGYSPALGRWLSRHIQEYNLVQIHGVFADPTISAAVAAWRAHIPYVVRPCGQLDPWSLRKTRYLKSTFLKLIGWHILNRAGAVHATSEMEAYALKRLGVTSPIVTIPLGIDSASMEIGRPPGEFRKEYPEFDGKKIILFLSRFDPVKGLDLLLQATKELASKRKDFVLVLAGSGASSFEKQVRAQVSRDGLSGFVRFCGFLDGRPKRAALEDANLFVLVSYHENFGVAVVEAMAAGLPVVISDQVGIHHEVREYEAGLVTRCDAGEIAEALHKLLDGDSLRRRMGGNGRRLVQEKFAWSQVGAELLKLYQSVLAAGCPILV